MTRATGGDVRLGEVWSPLQRAKNDAIYLVARLALAVAIRAPRPFVRAAAKGLGLLGWCFWPSGRRRVDCTLARALGARAPASRAVFAGLGATLAATVDVLRDDAELPLHLEVEDERTLRAAVARGKGVVFATAHLGAWEAIGPALVERGFVVATVARRSYDPRFDRIYDRLREARGVRALYRGDPGFAKSLLRALHRGTVVGFTMDVAGRGVRAVVAAWPQGGRATPVGPAEIALRTGASVTVGTAAPGGRLRVEDVPIHQGETAPALTERLAGLLGQRLLDLPEQWPWMHADAELPVTPSAVSLPTPVTRR